MLNTSIQSHYDLAGRKLQLPTDVLMRMEDADRVLQDELKDLEQYPVPITAKWASEMVDPGVWEIVL